MTPKEKALELFEKYLTPNLVSPIYGVLSYQDAKQCALIAVDEILFVLGDYGVYGFADPKVAIYWEEVKDEINKL